MDRTPPTKDSLPTATNGHTVDIKGSQTTSEDDRTNGASIVTQQTSTLVGMPSPTKKSNLNGQGHPQPSRSSFLSRLFRMIVPCVFPSPAAHPIELPDTPHPITPLPQEKPPLKSPEIQHGVPEEVPKPESSKPTVDTLVQNVPATTESLEVVVPPTPTTPHLLPSEETEGMTSGAVQPPGSKGDSPTQEKSQHSPISENEESEYSEEDIEDPEDDEDRLIYNGGAGIPIGSVSSYWNFFRFFCLFSSRTVYLDRSFPQSHPTTRAENASSLTWTKPSFTVASRLVLLPPPINFTQ